MELIFSLLQQLSVYLVIAYLLSKTPLFMPLTSLSGHFSQRFACYVVFSLFCILGSYFGLAIDNAIANTRAIGAVMGGLLGGPLVGVAVGFTGGIHRYSLGGFTDVACAISTTSEGLFGGLVHLYFMRRGSVEKIFKTAIVLIVVLIAEFMQMAIILWVAQPAQQAIDLVETIAKPMIIANSVGAALFMSIIQDRKAIYERYSAAFSNKALRIAEQTVGILDSGFNPDNTKKVAQIIYRETGVGAVSITDRHKIMAFTGIGADHHLPGTPISSKHTKQAIKCAEIIFADGYEVGYQCSIKSNCKLGAALIIPLMGSANNVLGTIKLYEPKQKLFSSLNRSLGVGLAKLLSNQILSGRYLDQQRLLMQSELRLMQAQVNPHFLFNALNTISAVIRRDPDKARQLIQHLAQFFRRNLKHNIDLVSVQDEVAHMQAYLEIEHARFSDKLAVSVDIDAALMSLQVPTFTLQPLVENAIKHGIATQLYDGRVDIIGRCRAGVAEISVIDNAGTYRQQTKQQSDGLGIQLVDKRLKNHFGSQYGLQITCVPGESTCAQITFPVEGGSHVNSDCD